MSELLIFDPADNLLAVLSNEAEGACDFWSAPFREVVNNGSFFEFIAQGDHEDSQYLVAENQVAFEDKDGYFRLFVIKEPDQTNGINGPQIHCICEPAMNELNEELIEDVRPYDTTLADAQNRALKGTRWKAGITADLGLNSVNYYYISVNEAIQENINTWGGEIRDRIEIGNNKITGRYIDTLPRRGQDTGKLWEIDKDILSLSHKVQSYPKTALYGRGASLETENGGFTRKITFADIEWKKSNGDPADKPKGQEWVGDPEALSAFGRLNEDGTKRHRKGIYENGEQEDPAALLMETWEALQQQKHQFHNYEMDVFLLEEISGYEHEKVRLGDTTIAIDRSFANPIEIEERVISYEYDVSDPDNTGKVELGQYIDLYSDDDRLEKVEAQLNDKSGIWNRVEEPVTDEKIANIKPPKTLNVVATGNVRSIVLEWDYVHHLYIANYEVFASQIKGFTPDPSNLVFRGKASMYTHKAESNQQWYFRVRAVNTHGVAGELSDEAMAQTARIITEDILFGPEIAAELRELSKTADLLADKTVDFNKIKDEAIADIQSGANVYTDEQIQSTEQAILGTLNSRLSDVDSDIASVNSKANGIQEELTLLQGNVSSMRTSINDDIASLNATSANLLQRVSDNEISLEQNGGKIISIEQNIDTINGSLSLTISELSNLEGTVSSQQTSITAMQTEISLRATKDSVDTLTGRVTTAEGSISVLQGAIVLKANSADVYTKSEMNTELGKKVNTTTYNSKMSQLDVSISGITANVTSIESSVSDVDSRLSSAQSQLDIQAGQITAKAEKTDVYTKTEADGKISSAITSAKAEIKITTDGIRTDVTSLTNRVGTAEGEIDGVQSFASSIDQKADSIQSSVSSLTQTVNSQGTRLSTAETTISQQAGTISLKANATDVYTKAQVNTELGKKVDTTTYNNKMSQLDVSISGISGRVTNTETNMNTLTGELNTAKSQIASLDIKANSISASVSEVRADFDELQLGGTNILRDSYSERFVSNTITSGTITRTPSIPTGLVRIDSTGEGTFFAMLNSNTPGDRDSYYLSGEDYTVSFDVRGNVDRFDYCYLMRDEDGGNSSFPNKYVSLSLTDWTRVSITRTAVFTTEKGYILIGSRDIGIGKWFEVRKIKVERGRKDSDWSPNPIEVDGRITSAESSITVLTNQVNLKASQTSVDSLTGRMSKAESSITVLSNQISLKVDADGLISAINLQPGTVKIQAKLIDLQGDVYIVNGTTRISNAAVGTAAIANASIERGHLKNAIIGTAQIDSLAVTNAKIADLAIDTAKIADAAITSAKVSRLSADKITVGPSTAFSSGYNPALLEFGSVNLNPDSFTLRMGSNSTSTGTVTRTSGSPTGIIRVTSTGSGSNYGLLHLSQDRTINYIEGSDYTVSFELRGNVSSLDYIYMMRNDGTNASFPGEVSPISTTAWTRVSITRAAPWTTKEGYILLGTRDVGSGKWFEVRKLKIARSAKEDEWSPNPDEVQAQIDESTGTLNVWRYQNTTYIDGGNIYANTVNVNALKSGTINTDIITIANSKVRVNNNGLFVYKSGVMGASLVEGNLTFYDQGNAQQIGLFAATVWSDGNTKGISMNMEANRYVSFGHYTGVSTGYTPMMVLNPGTAMVGVPRGIVANLPYRANEDIWLGTWSLRFGQNNNHNHAAIYKSAGDDLIISSYQAIGLAHIQSGGVTSTKLSVDSNTIHGWVDLDMHGWRILRAANVQTTSFATEKSDIRPWSGSALKEIKENTTIYEYRLNSDIERGIYKLRQGLVIGEGYITPEGLFDEGGVDLYGMASWNTKAIQELAYQVDGQADDINWLKIENQFLKQKIKKLEARIDAVA